jgi:phage terminase large subunit-like protein
MLHYKITETKLNKKNWVYLNNQKLLWSKLNKKYQKSKENIQIISKQMSKYKK